LRCPWLHRAFSVADRLQEPRRVHDGQVWESLAESLTCRRVRHQIEQVPVSTHQVASPDGDGQINIQFILGIAGKANTFGTSGRRTALFDVVQEDRDRLGGQRGN
jgi:hypothetical protein